MNFLALDLGTQTGYAWNHDDVFECGTWQLATKTEIAQWGKDRFRRRCDPRIPRLYARILMLHDAHKFDGVVFEDVQFASTTYQAQLWSSLRAAVWLSVPSEIIDCVPVGTLKNFATGHGAAPKNMMALALCRRDSRFVKQKKNVTFSVDSVAEPIALDDNAVDAVWLHKWAEANLSRKYVTSTSTSSTRPAVS
ncbi:hypothetical protein L0337_27200 [candidate division KSB1 bacterium]|nr:hypothetical protein [candidate division KSB1 bacterium]